MSCEFATSCNRGLLCVTEMILTQRNYKPASWYIIEIMTAQSVCLCVRSNKSAKTAQRTATPDVAYTEHLQKKMRKVA